MPEVVLTPKEKQLAALLLKGYTSADMAEELGMAETTVRGHFNRMYLKFGIDNRWSKRVRLAMMLYRQSQ